MSTQYESYSSYEPSPRAKAERVKDIVCSFTAGMWLTYGLLEMGVNDTSAILFGGALLFVCLANSLIFDI